MALHVAHGSQPFQKTEEMNNLKIGQRLTLGFGVVVALMLIVVAMGVKALAGMDDTIENIVSDNNVKIEAVFTLRHAEQQLAIAVRDLTW